MVRNRKRKVMEPLFPNYLFVKFDYEFIHFSTINSTRGEITLFALANYQYWFPMKLLRH